LQMLIIYRLSVRSSRGGSHPFTIVPLTATEMAKFLDWFSLWYLNFSQLPYGQSWLKLINQWTTLKKGYGFKLLVCTPILLCLCIF
jgi:hypothetical protein